MESAHTRIPLIRINKWFIVSKLCRYKIQSLKLGIKWKEIKQPKDFTWFKHAIFFFLVIKRQKRTKHTWPTYMAKETWTGYSIIQGYFCQSLHALYFYIQSTQYNMP